MILNYYLFKIEKDKPEMNVDKTVCYMNTIQLSKELNIKNEICPNPDPEKHLLAKIYQIINCFRIKTEHNTSSDMKVEADLDASTLHTEFDMKNESDASISNDVTKNEVPRNDEQVVADEETDGDIFVCSHCLYATRSKRDLINHVKVHNTRANVYSCCYCNFRTNSGILFTTHIKIHSSETTHFASTHYIEKKNDDNFSQANSTHSVAKYQEITGNRSFTTCKYCNKTFVPSVSRKVQECSRCSYKTIYPYRLRQHIVAKHPDIAGNRITNRCIYCNKTLTSKASLDDHVVKIHPDFITSVSRKVRECSSCTYKTIRPYLLRKHIVAEHPDIAGNFTTNKCVYCNKTFVYKRSLDDHIVKKHPDFIASVSGTVHKCTKCTYKTVSKSHLKRHILAKHPDIAGNIITNKCTYCNKTFTSKGSLDDHIVKAHPDFIASVSRKVQECSRCTYKTILTRHLKRHTLAKHPDIAGNLITNKCTYCNKTFTTKESLEDHIVKAHPDFIAYVSRKVHKCTKCSYKTVQTSKLKRHMAKHPDGHNLAKHPDIAGNRVLIRCIYCNKTFTSKLSLDDHIVKKHPDFIVSVSRKVHECSRCTYKTILTSHLKGHNLAKHPDIAGNRVLIRCIYCNKTFTSKLSLDDHIVKKHPDFIASVSRKVHECSRCTYKTTFTSCLKGHIRAKHPDIAYNIIINRCIYCNKTFTSKLSLDDHIVKRHPDFIASVSRKVHECSRCTYKTIITSHLKGHNLAKHPDIAGNRVLIRCIYCKKTFTSKRSLEDHIVKTHPDFIASVSSKIHECIRCTYKTTNIRNFKKHSMVKHPEISGNRICTKCAHCNAKFRSKLRLDDHVVNKHPDFIGSVTSEIYECTKCTYKTTTSTNFREHSMVKHPEIFGNRICSRCTYCNKTFMKKRTLDNHIVKRHTELIASVSRKIHRCTKCTYKTTINYNLKRHVIANHPDIAGNLIANRCIYCNITFVRKQTLDDHIVRKHQNLIASASSKVHG
nr:unnamed protein product [Callosobruchus analis]